MAEWKWIIAGMAYLAVGISHWWMFRMDNPDVELPWWLQFVCIPGWAPLFLVALVLGAMGKLDD